MQNVPYFCCVLQFMYIVCFFLGIEYLEMNKISFVESDISLLNQFATFYSDKGKWQCKKCFKTVSRTSTMLSHIRAMHARVLYRCGKCNLSFHEKRLLINHKQTHIVEKPFSVSFQPPGENTPEFSKLDDFKVGTNLSYFSFA